MNFLMKIVVYVDIYAIVTILFNLYLPIDQSSINLIKINLNCFEKKFFFREQPLNETFETLLYRRVFVYNYDIFYN